MVMALNWEHISISKGPASTRIGFSILERPSSSSIIVVIFVQHVHGELSAVEAPFWYCNLQNIYSKYRDQLFVKFD